MALRELKNKNWIRAKALGFGGIFLMSLALLIIQENRWWRTGLAVLLAWSSARGYYFLFYVIEHYLDPGFRFTGLWSALLHLARRRR